MNRYRDVPRFPFLSRTSRSLCSGQDCRVPSYGPASAMLKAGIGNPSGRKPKQEGCQTSEDPESRGGKAEAPETRRWLQRPLLLLLLLQRARARFPRALLCCQESGGRRVSGTGTCRRSRGDAGSVYKPPRGRCPAPCAVCLPRLFPEPAGQEEQRDAFLLCRPFFPPGFQERLCVPLRFLLEKIRIQALLGGLREGWDPVRKAP